MHFEHTILMELPFILNVPDGKYDVTLPSGAICALTIHSKYYAGSDGAFEYASNKAYGPKHSLPSAFPGASNMSVVKLRTVVEMRLERTIEEAAAKQPTETDLVDQISRELIQQRATNSSGEALRTESATILSGYSPQQREQLRGTCLRRLIARELFPPKLGDDFLAAVNIFVRQYMVTVEDFFVEEVALHQVTGTTMGGVLHHTRCDGVEVESVTTVGLIPPIMRSPWFEHPKPKIDALKQAVAAGTLPNAIELLGIRARHLVECGAHRSAIIEAAAALETAIARRLIAALIAGGKSESDAIQFLKDNKRFCDRGKTHFKAIVGQSLADHSPALWSRVVVHRENLRHKIAHSDLEPSATETKAAVDDFLAMAKIAQTIR